MVLNQQLCLAILFILFWQELPVLGLRDLKQLSNATEGAEVSIAVPVSSRIYGGGMAPMGRYPYMSSLRTNGHLHRCGGVLIKPTWILTAAHCVDPTFSDSLGINPVVYIGGWDIDDDETSDKGVEVVRPIQTVIHPGWTGEVQNGNDLALLRLDSPSGHQHININSVKNELHTGQKLVAIGWGELEDGSPSRFLQHAIDLEFVSLKNCQKIPYTQSVDDGIICAYADTQDTCKGDSGGPLILADHRMGDVDKGSPKIDLLVGITSFGPAPCTQTDLPSVSTDAAFFHEWIMKTMDEGGPVPQASIPNPPKVPVQDTTRDAEELETVVDSEQPVQGVEPRNSEDIKFVVLQSEEEDDDNETTMQEAEGSSSVPQDRSPSPSPSPEPVPSKAVQQSSPSPVAISGTREPPPRTTPSLNTAREDHPSKSGPQPSAPSSPGYFGLSRQTWYSSSGRITLQGSHTSGWEPSRSGQAPSRTWVPRTSLSTRSWTSSQSVSSPSSQASSQTSTTYYSSSGGR